MADEHKPSQATSGKEAKASYFAKLDAALAKLTASSPPTVASGTPLPKVVLLPTPAAAPVAAVTSSERHPAEEGTPAKASGLVAEAFAALLALEDGEPGAKPVRLTTRSSEPPAAPQITDAFMDDVVGRVIERLGPDAARAAVTELVSGIAERLVKEEIARIRDKHA